MPPRSLPRVQRTLVSTSPCLVRYVFLPDFLSLWGFIACYTERASQTQAASSSLYISKQCFPNQIYIFKNPSDNHKPKKLPVLWGLIRRNSLSGTSKSLALNFSAEREGSRRVSESQQNRPSVPPLCCSGEKAVLQVIEITLWVCPVSLGPREWGRLEHRITH